MSDFSELFGGNWNAEEEAAAAANEEKNYAPLEPGWYKMMVEAPNDGAMIRDSKAGGKYLKVCFRVAPGEARENRVVFHNINLLVKPKDDGEAARANAATAERIGRHELAKLCIACGKPMAKDSAELVDSILLVRVAIGKNSKGEPENEVKDFKPATGNGVPVPTTQAAPAPVPSAQKPAPAAPAGNAGKLPWQM